MNIPKLSKSINICFYNFLFVFPLSVEPKNQKTKKLLFFCLFIFEHFSVFLYAQKAGWF